MPLAVLEAMAAGVPVVATRVTGNTDLVVDGESGLLFDLGAAETAADLLLRLAVDDSTWRTMAVLARERAVECFSVQRMATAMKKLYGEAL